MSNIVTLAVALGIGLSQAGTASRAATVTSSMAVSATVIASCVVGTSANRARLAPLDVSCSHAVPYRVETTVGARFSSVMPSTSRGAGADAATTLTTVTY